MKMIRQFGESSIALVVNLILFLFNGIKYIFTLPNRIYVYIKLFLEDTDAVLKESLIALSICAVGDLCAGIILGNMEFFLKTYPGLMVIIPGAIGMRGNIFGSFGSRLSTHLHIGTLSPEFKRSEILSENITASLILTMVLSILLAVIAKGVCIAFGFKSISIYDFVLISFIAGLISTIIMLPITMFISLKSFEGGWDPDNITTPFIAAVGDFFTLPAIILSVIIVGFISIIPIVKMIVFVAVIFVTIAALIAGYTAKSDVRHIVRQSTPVLFICSLLGTFAGGILNDSLTTLLKNQTLLTLVPLFSGESGGLVSILGARLSSGLHSGLIDPVLRPKKHTVENFVAILTLSVVMYPVIGFLAESSTIAFGNIGVGILESMSISFLAGMILILLMLLVVFYISTISYRRGLDPDNIVIPLSTSLTDSISTLILIVVSLGLLNYVF
ncbi:divalent cation transporter mgtE family [Methanobrevibacter ruminantium M1]|uniref:Divalent cation transporter mgtE family n=1 Tax=Methanobrevibacter ruminantium (strain ATCC 35063 / DSM 1093 / JCM 13430 / OCM 146 / M1) TaxID=634498 RepID=D3E1H3_METRM|nr:divalent cation transporter mgtE family [Methanobrevibacter ruminantium M1]